jgi:hypothetical protein
MSTHLTDRMPYGHLFMRWLIAVSAHGGNIDLQSEC